LTTDLLLLLQEPGVVLSQDASGCYYDWIQHAIGGISMERQKVPEPTIICMFSTPQDLERNIQTAYGDSSITYGGGNLWVVPLQGIGQGNGAGTPLWAIVISPLLEMLQTAGFGTLFQDIYLRQED
jgi:hypothetical protein